jgi:xylan 1,4-beta-xylosidase
MLQQAGTFRARAARLLASAAFALCVCLTSVPARQATYRNPVIAGDYPDPTVVRVGSEYWAAATTGGWAPHFALLHSRDLVNWQHVGYLFKQKPAWARGDFWAPELISDGGRMLVFYTARRDEGPKARGTLCVAVATAPTPAGPYTDRGPLVCEIPERANVGSIDPFFVRDERGRPFLVWKADGNDAEPDVPTSIFAQRLSEDGTRLTGRRREILRNTEAWERHVTEGSFIMRRGGWFYHFYSGNACCGRECLYALGVARARRLLGPWEKYPRNPILAADRDWQCPGHGDIVETPDGRDFLLYHSYRKRRDTFSVGREALLDEVTWSADGWPAINGGAGPTTSATAPLGVAKRDEAEFFDGFDGAALGPEWQWPMNNPPAARVEVAGGGYLVLASGAAGDADRRASVVGDRRAFAVADQYTAAVVAHRTTSGDYTATALVETRGRGDARGASAGVRAGLSAYGWRDGALGVAVGGGRIVVWRREGREEMRVAERDAPASNTLYLRMTAEGGERYRFAFSADGRVWTDVGGWTDGAFIEGTRVALTAAGGAARFDWIRITPTKE